MSLKRKLGAGVVALLIAGGATGAGLAASGHGRGLHGVRHIDLASTSRAGFLRATAQYLETSVASLRHEEKAGRTLAQIANTTSGRSAKQLTGVLAAAALVKLQGMSDHVLSRMQARVLNTWLVRRIKGFLNGTCPLAVSGTGFEKHLLGCAHMSHG